MEAGIIIAIIVGVIAIVTLYYTRKGARSTEEQTELMRKDDPQVPLPQVSLDIFPHITTGPICRPRIVFLNAGAKSVYLEKIYIEFRHDEAPEESHSIIINVEKYVLPGGNYIRERMDEFDYSKFPGFESVQDVRGAHLKYHSEFLDALKNRHRWPPDGEKTRSIK